MLDSDRPISYPDDYFGLYVSFEHIEGQKNRLNLTKASAQDLTGKMSLRASDSFFSFVSLIAKNDKESEVKKLRRSSFKTPQVDTFWTMSTTRLAAL
jgi:hypothetical protein